MKHGELKIAKWHVANKAQTKEMLIEKEWGLFSEFLKCV